MILRSPAENENGGVFLGALFPRDSSFPRTRESRFASALNCSMSLDTRFRGYDGNLRFTSVFRVLHLYSSSTHGIFEGGHEDHESFEYAFRLRVLHVLRGACFLRDSLTEIDQHPAADAALEDLVNLRIQFCKRNFGNQTAHVDTPLAGKLVPRHLPRTHGNLD